MVVSIYVPRERYQNATMYIIPTLIAIWRSEVRWAVVEKSKSSARYEKLNYIMW